jgi:uncharacterized protein
VERRRRRLLSCGLGLPLGFALVCTAVAFALLRSSAPPSASGGPRPVAVPEPRSTVLSIVIDDIGRELPILEALLELDLDLTFSVLPHAEETSRAIALVKKRGRELLVHLPLLPLDTRALSDEPVVVGMGDHVEEATTECLARVPGAKGVNNHMGSAVSLDVRTLARILPLVGRRGFFFLDSRTIASSRICEVALSTGVPCRERDVFLDDPPAPASIRSRLEEAIALARSRGRAIAIGHPIPATLQALRLFAGRKEVRVGRLSDQYRGEGGRRP